MKFKVISILCILTLGLSSFAQSGRTTVRQDDPLESLREKEYNGQVSIFLDSLLEENYKKHLVSNSKNRGIAGYRVRIFSDTGRGAKDNQKRLRASFLSLYPDVKTYSEYEGSYFKIYVGDYRTKNEAILLLERIKKNFPDAFVVEDNIVIEE